MTTDEHLLAALREQNAAQKELIAALRARIATLENRNLFPCGCQTPNECVYNGGGGFLAYGVQCKLHPQGKIEQTLRQKETPENAT